MHSAILLKPANTAAYLPVSLVDHPDQVPWYHVHRESVFPGISDKFASLLAPVLTYWVVSLIYHGLDISGFQWLQKYRIQESEEVKSKNLVTRREVIRTVAFSQFIQTTFGYIWFTALEVPTDFQNHAVEWRELSVTIARNVLAVLGDVRGQEFLNKYGYNLTYHMFWWAIPIFQFFIALFILDTYQYFVHRLSHEVNFFYRHFHSMHHRLYVPYAFGALYVHPFESAFVDGLSATLAHSLAGLTDRQGILLFVFSTIKSVDDHCGYLFPWHPIHVLFGNNAEHHDIHHQHAGIKSNYSSPFFLHWDVILGTRMTMAQLLVKKPELKQQ